MFLENYYKDFSIAEIDIYFYIRRIYTLMINKKAMCDNLVKYIYGPGDNQTRGIKLEKDITVALCTTEIWFFSIKMSDKNEKTFNPQKAINP